MLACIALVLACVSSTSAAIVATSPTAPIRDATITSAPQIELLKRQNNANYMGWTTNRNGGWETQSCNSGTLDRRTCYRRARADRMFRSHILPLQRTMGLLLNYKRWLSERHANTMFQRQHDICTGDHRDSHKPSQDLRVYISLPQCSGQNILSLQHLLYVRK
jgi:hypothetical protein